MSKTFLVFVDEGQTAACFVASDFIKKGENAIGIVRQFVNVVDFGGRWGYWANDIELWAGV